MKILLVSHPDTPLLPLFSKEIQDLFAEGSGNQLTVVHSLTSTIDLIRSNEFDRVVSQEDIPVSSELHPVESFVGAALVGVCIRHDTPLALLIREDSPLYVDPSTGGGASDINLPINGGKFVYLFTEKQLGVALMRSSIEKAIFTNKKKKKPE